MSIQQMLEESINIFGLSDEITILLSQKRDKQIVEVQKLKYEDYKKEEGYGM